MVCGDVIRICSGRIQRDNNGGCVFRVGVERPARSPLAVVSPSLYYIVMPFAFQICTRSTTAPIARRISRAYVSSASSAPNSTFACRWVDRSDDHFVSRDSLASPFPPSFFDLSSFPRSFSLPSFSPSQFFFLPLVYFFILQFSLLVFQLSSALAYVSLCFRVSHPLVPSILFFITYLYSIRESMNEIVKAKIHVGGYFELRCV